MQKLLRLLILFIPFAANGQNKKLVVKGYHGNEFSLWGEPYLKKLDSKEKIKGETVRGNLVFVLDSGSYLLVQCSNLGDYYIDTIQIRDKRRYNYNLTNAESYYKTIQTESLLSEKLRIGDSLKVYYISSGCFDLSYNSVLLVKVDSNKFHIKFYLERLGCKDTIIDTCMFLKFVQVEKVISTPIKEFQCTTRKYYSMAWNRNLKSFEDGKCGEEDFYWLYKEIFGKD